MRPGSSCHSWAAAVDRADSGPRAAVLATADGIVAALWSLALLPLLGFPVWAHETAHAVTAGYLPFVAVLGGLYVAAEGSCCAAARGRPWGNTAMLALGALLALVMGTAGAAMVIIQPLLRANAHRRRRFHLVLFLILLVGNTAAC